VRRQSVIDGGNLFQELLIIKENPTNFAKSFLIKENAFAFEPC
jgi:hypothetical protein